LCSFDLNSYLKDTKCYNLLDQVADLMGNEKHMSSQQKNDLPTGLAKPAQRALAGAGIHNLEQLSKFSLAEVKKLHGIGPNALTQLSRALAEKGLSFAGGAQLEDK
jgi:hypothetical protein